MMTAPLDSPTLDVAPLDTRALTELVDIMDSIEVVEDIVITYVTATLPLIEAVRSMNDVHSVRRAAHALKSSSRSVGAVEVANAAEMIEAATDDGTLEAVVEECTSMPRLFSDACAALTQWIEEQQG